MHVCLERLSPDHAAWSRIFRYSWTYLEAPYLTLFDIITSLACNEDMQDEILEARLIYLIFQGILGKKIKCSQFKWSKCSHARITQWQHHMHTIEFWSSLLLKGILNSTAIRASIQKEVHPWIISTFLALGNLRKARGSSTARPRQMHGTWISMDFYQTRHASPWQRVEDSAGCCG